jgi:hypothetical protein
MSMDVNTAVLVIAAGFVVLAALSWEALGPDR